MLSVNHLYLMKHRVRETCFNWGKTALVVGILVDLADPWFILRAGPSRFQPRTQGFTGGVQSCRQNCQTRGGQCPGGEDDFSPSGRP